MSRYIAALPDSLQDGTTAEALRTICDLDLSEPQAIIPPRAASAGTDYPPPGLTPVMHRDLPRPPLCATPKALRCGRGSLLCMTPNQRRMRGRDWTRKGGRNWKRFDARPGPRFVMGSREGASGVAPILVHTERLRAGHCAYVGKMVAFANPGMTSQWEDSMVEQLPWRLGVPPKRQATMVGQHQSDFINMVTKLQGEPQFKSVLQQIEEGHEGERPTQELAG
jgi:hypothetical protein